MRKNKLLILMIITLCAAVADAQKRSNNMQMPVFSSVYSDMSHGKSCRTIEPEFVGCKPVGGYRVFAGFHSVLERIWIETVGGVEITDLPSHNQPGITRSAGKIEWRLADGKPFAVIARFEVFSMEDVEADRDLSPDRSKFAQILVVKGLPGYQHIDLEFDPRLTPISNQKARDLADEGFMKKTISIKNDNSKATVN